MSFVDLHLHSTASDGTAAPEEVVRRAAEAGLSGISLTDHDTVGGLEEARAEARRRGIDFLPGAELSANEPGRGVHLLAYGFEPTDPGMSEFFRTFREDRVRRAREIVRRLNELGVDLDYDAVSREATGGLPTRAHVARALVREGHAPDEETTFRRWIARGGPAFVEKRPTPPRQVFEMVHAAGGVVLLAHPGRAFGADDVRRWVDEGLDGVEVLHPGNDPGVRTRLNHLASELDLLRGGGSDWHGEEDRHAGVGSQDVPASWMEAIEARCRTGSVGPT